MTAQNEGQAIEESGGDHSERLKDEVYRQMFRLEARRPGADLNLALALLRASIACDSRPRMREFREWMKKICPICVLMIEASLQPDKASQMDVQ